MDTLKYTDILRLNKSLEPSPDAKPYKIRVLSNIIVHQLKEILEYTLRKEGIPAIVEPGDYDNIVQDSTRFQDSDCVIIFWELANLVDGFHYRAELIEPPQLENLLNKTAGEIGFVTGNLKHIPVLIINAFTALPFTVAQTGTPVLGQLAQRLNQILESHSQNNLSVIQHEKAIASAGVENAIDWRYYYTSKALYKIDFFRHYAQLVKPLVLSATGKVKKALIFDCDNTLWKGIIGEDGFDGIEMSSKTRQGIYFEEVQHIALSLKKKGILLGLCSKNNPEDVDEVLRNHPDMVIREEDITIKKVNWQDKVTNLKAIAEELNIGLDSLVFIDDSPFEVEYVRQQLPEVTVLQVPEKLYEYPRMVREHLWLFYKKHITEEDLKKAEMYKQQAKRAEARSRFADIDSYLASLELKMTLFTDDASKIPRIAQMTQKTNQFNLTTRRYTEADIERFIQDPDHRVIAFRVEDKFGDSGITGLVIINLNQDERSAEIDTFLMSCRVIGRNLEFAFIDHIIDLLRNENIETLYARYIPTVKNKQVSDLYEKFGFELLSDNGIKDYRISLSNYKPSNIPYITVIHG